MRLRRFLLVPTVALAAFSPLWSADQAAPAPVAEISLADGNEIIARWEKSPLARVLADPAMAALRTSIDAWQKEAAAKLGGTPLELLAALKNTGLVVRAGDAPDKPVFFASSEMGVFAAKFFALMKENATEAKPATVANADEAFSTTSGKYQPVFARFATGLAIGINAPTLTPATRSAPLAHDLVASMDILEFVRLIFRAIDDPQSQAELAASEKQMVAAGMGPASYQMDITAEGFLEHVAFTMNKTPGYAAVDQAQIARLPATTLMAISQGLDGVAYWKANRETLLTSLAKLVGTQSTDLDATEIAVNTAIKDFGIPVTLGELVQGFVGSFVFGISQSMPFPAISWSLPRSPALDQAVIALLAKIGAKAPEEGSSLPVPLPGVPVAITLVRDATSWFITSDATAGDIWLSGKPGGWAETPAMKLALSKAPAGANCIGASDTPAVLRVIAGYAGMALGMAKDMPAESKQATLKGLNLLASQAATGYIVSGRKDDQVITEIRSLTGLVPLPFAVGIMGVLVKNSVTVQATPTAQNQQKNSPKIGDPQTTLRSVIFPAQIQFQAGAYFDQDHDGIGEYGLLSELSGRRPIGGPEIALIDGPLSKSASAHGYAYAIYLPSATGSIADDGKKEARAAIAENADSQEKSFVAYAWPVRTKDGRMFAMTANGSVYEAAYTGKPPVWNDVFGGKSWTDAPVWKTASSTAGTAPVEQPTPDVLP